MNLNIAQLESAYQELIQLQKENLTQGYEIALLRIKVAEEIAIAEIKAKRYFGIKKYFNRGKHELG